MPLLSTKWLQNIVFITSLLILTQQAASAKFVLTAPPRESPKAGEKFYAPIAKELSKLLGEEVEYRHPQTWHQYTSEMRAGNYDVVFDGPHFASWRIKNAGHVPVARLYGSLRFYVMAKNSDNSIKSMRDLLGKQICGLASPNLATVSAFNLFQNPIIQPEIKIIKGGMKTVMKKFLDGSCRFAVVRDKIYNKLPAKQRMKINIIAKSKIMPNQSITVSKRFTPDKIAKLTAFLTSSSGANSADNLLSRFSKKKKFFIPTKTREYTGISELLEGVIFGW